ncbi:MAG: NAD(P)/FAD-dependent oxidoreductase [Christensenellales bacterium]|jgi:predicted Rossmann fold flavoprotein
MKSVCVVGGGPAGMMAAYAAAAKGHSVRLFEKNGKLGKKLYITGKGRCNITNAAPIEDFFDKVVTNNTFLYSSFYTFGNTDLTNMMSQFGLKIKTERGGRVFPVSDKSSDVIKTLEKALKKSGAEYSLNATVQNILVKDGCATGITCAGKPLLFDSMIIATGGLSYPSTGSTGDGYTFAQHAGHTIVQPSASLVAVDTIEDLSALAGLTLKNIGFSLMHKGKAIFSSQGEMLFTHTGISGPLVLSASAYIKDGKHYEVVIDLKPALDFQMLDARLLRDMENKSNKHFSNVLSGLLPSNMIDFIAGYAGISIEKKAHSITKQERKGLVKTLKSLRLSIKGKRPIEEAVITRGGVNVKEIDASTMQSKICKGLFFAGEVIDVDALTGGYNLQIAFSTGYLAGISC